ncbi:MAG: hypothetical protein WCP52_10120 [Bacteroidota bacterium]
MKKILFLISLLIIIKGEAQTNDTTAKVKSKRYYSGITVAPNYVIGKLYRNLGDGFNRNYVSTWDDKKEQSIGVTFSYRGLVVIKKFFLGIGIGGDYLSYKGLFTEDVPDNIEHMKYLEYYHNKLFRISFPIGFNMFLDRQKRFYTGLFYDFNFIVYANQIILLQTYSYSAGGNIYEQKVNYDFAKRQSNGSYGINLGYKLFKLKRTELNLTLSVKQSAPISTLYYPQYPFSQYKNNIQYNSLLLNFQIFFL